MKTIKYFFGILLIATVALAIQSCSDKDSTTAATASYINLYQNGNKIDSYTTSLSASYRMIGVRSDADWTASSDADWCTISNDEGYGYGADSSFYVRIDVTKNSDVHRTAHVTFTAGMFSQVLTITQKGSDMDEGDPFESTFSVVEHMTLGYNLGNTLDSDPYTGKPSTDLAYETSWGQPKTTQAIIDSIAKKGFNVIRIPVTWWPHMESDGTVREVWMNRVKEVVDMVLNANCYCILNVQHDTGSRLDDDGVLRTDSAGWLSADASEYSANSARYMYLWSQIASTFKDYDQHLLFESFNEILDGDKSTWSDPSDAECYTTINKLQQDFVDVVRATGGNNEYRNLVITTYSAGTTQAKLDGFNVPEDIHPNHLLASVHSYDPYNFCNNNKGADYDYNIYIWNTSCEQEIDELTQRVDSRFTSVGIPYIYGEFGAIDENKDTYERCKYAAYMVNKFKQYNTRGSWWMGLYSRRWKKWYDKETDARKSTGSQIVTTLFNTLNGTSSSAK